MSHISKIEVEIHSLEDLKQACKQLGFRFCENQKTHKWYGTNSESENKTEFGNCDHAIRVPKCKYEIGVVKQGNHFSLLWDITPQMALLVYLEKHMDAIRSYIRYGSVMSEPIEGRIKDARV